MPESDLSLLVAAAKTAGGIAKQFVGTEARKWDKPDGAGPVTEADLAVNRYLEDHLQAARPDYGWLSEESEDNSDRLSRSRVFIIDPIDGTRSFAEGSRTWAHSLAVVEDGEPVAAVVYLPQRDLLFAARKGGGATCNGSPIAVSRANDAATAHVLCAKPTLSPAHWRAGTAPDFTRSHRPSLAYRMARVADGSYDAMLTLRPTWEWDIAAGALLLTEAGGQISNRAGGRLRFNRADALQDGVVAGGSAMQQQLLSRLVYPHAEPSQS
ncbi:3'(2'),5'-bisphosphate nucleotidase CysQ [Phaeobacter sp. HF9A]|uniref:3'(2'),5'-bisphosphate nucleotidase CysQ n=1 Tax=Phaeobacter sp. HF9A TaxID=2721561 RepID=UPI00143174F1|nr:3'(2'),5'-bisphosphate nucleotidase CysQ [Phaeobacter sp. HF9A]NIZ14684.1 3'(2'),5'-bisphosphate nucleotidase CysQ [Phaeobacter sp. HF9A]